MKLSILAAGAALAVAGAANADTIFSNPYDGSGSGDCSWSTTCAAEVGRGDDFAAQAFTLTHGATITGAAFEELPGYQGGGVTDVNWGFIQADGVGGAPGSILEAGTDSVTSYGTGGNGSVMGFFGTGPIHLGPGTYYFAVQGVTPNFEEFLAQGTLVGGNYNTHDGGVSWIPGYYCEGGGDCLSSVAVSLYGSFDGGVPEPATWAMMLVGFAGAGAMLRRRAKAIA